MTTNRSRNDLFRLLEPTLGDEAADALIEEFHSVDRENLATREDVAAIRSDVAAVRDDLAQVDVRLTRVEGDVSQLKTDVSQLKTDVGELRADLRVHAAHTDGRFDLVMDAIERNRNEVIAAYRGELIAAVTGQTRAIIFSMAAALAGVSALAVSLARFA